jgi:hypothetical protein
LADADTKAAAKEVGTLLVRLKRKGQLPGWSKEDTFANESETVQLPHRDSAIFSQVRKKGDASIYHYEFGVATNGVYRRLKQAATLAMQKLRSIHLYLGCVFAPMLLFFAVSGICQTLGLHNRSHLLERLSTIHTSHGLKTGGSLSSVLLRWFVLIMALGFITTTILGIVMSLRLGKSRRVAFYCLAAGVGMPVAIILFTVWRQ